LDCPQSWGKKRGEGGTPFQKAIPPPPTLESKQGLRDGFREVKSREKDVILEKNEVIWNHPLTNVRKLGPKRKERKKKKTGERIRFGSVRRKKEKRWSKETNKEEKGLAIRKRLTRGGKKKEGVQKVCLPQPRGRKR